MTAEQQVEGARLSWTNARSSRVSAERLQEVLHGELAAAQGRVTLQEQVIAMAYQREVTAKELYGRAEQANTADAKAAAAGREVAEQVTALQQRAGAAAAAKERAAAEELIATAALSAYLGGVGG